MNRRCKVRNDRKGHCRRRTKLSTTQIGVITLICLSTFFLGNCDDFIFTDLLDSSNRLSSGPLSISPISATVAVDSQFTFSASGGDPPYSFSIVAGSGTINESSGLYTAPSTAGMDTIQVTDSAGATSEAKVVYIE
jgi:hypothetical protein